MTSRVKSKRGPRSAAGEPNPAAPESAGDSVRQTGVYVYGIFPGDIKLESDLTGVGDPPGDVRIIRDGDIAALVSNVDASGPLGSPRDLTVHKEILDASATAVPVLPMRFGATLSDDDAVANDLLAANHDLFAAALDELDGLAQYVVKGRYAERAILQEVLSENREAAKLRDRIRSTEGGNKDTAKVRLGEVVHQAVAAKREMDTRTVLGRLAPRCEGSVPREPVHELDAVNVALLVRASEEEELRGMVDDLAHEWNGRVDLRLLGPMAAYDFVGTTGPEV